MIQFITNKWFHFFLLFSLLGSAILFSGSSNDLRQRLQYFVFDTYNKLYEREATNEVVIVDLDENSLRLIGQWPWPRDVMAELIQNLKSYGAKVIAFDVVFAEEDRTSPNKIAPKIPDNEEYITVRNLLSALPNHDEVFAHAIKNSGNIVTGFTSAKANETRRVPYQPIAPTYLLKDKENFFNKTYMRAGVATNLAKFSSSAAGNGHFMVQPETDGIIRRVPLFARYNPPNFETNIQTLYPLLSLEALRVSIDPKARIVIRDQKNKQAFDLNYEARLGEYSIPVDDGGKFWVHYRPIRDEEYISAHLALNPDEANTVAEQVKDKIVFIGTSAEGLRDIRSTALDQFVPGVEVHVNVVEQILQERYLTRSELVIAAETIVLCVLGFFLIILATFFNLLWVMACGLIFIGLMFLGSWYSYVEFGFLFDPVYPSITLFLLFVSVSLLKYLGSESDRRQVKMAFGHYISPVFMEELTKNPDKLKLGGEVRDLTVMFTDVRGFTSISERLSPEALIQLMNDFLTPMSDLVMQRRGTIDKYMGDAMMAFWNAPLDDPEHAKQACLTALKMNEALKPLNEELQKRFEGKENPIQISAGIGVNTGPCSVGNMGSEQRFAYSALGDAVNLASRLEGQTKTYGVEILIGEDTYQKVKDLACIEIDMIQVVGRDRPVKIYTILGDEKFKENAKFKKLKFAHDQMLDAYRTMKWDVAYEICDKILAMRDNQLSHYYKLYQTRIDTYKVEPPGESWSGLHIAKSK